MFQQVHHHFSLGNKIFNKGNVYYETKCVNVKNFKSSKNPVKNDNSSFRGLTL